MNPVLRTLLWVGAGLTLLSTVAMAALLWWLVGGAQGHFDLRFGGEPVPWPDWSAWQGWLNSLDWHGLLGGAAALLAAAMLLLAVPALFVLALLIGALFSAMGVAGVLLAVALLAALALSPLWLGLLLLWWLLRRDRTARRTVSP
jgi:hypothetical protein